MHGARRSAAVDVVEKLARDGRWRTVVVSDDRGILEQGRELGCSVRDTAGADFDWLGTLQEVVRAEAEPGEAVVVLGGCAAPLLDAGELAAVTLQAADGEVWQNNRLSPDLVLWKPAERVFRVEVCRNDNEFGYALERAGMAVRYFPGLLGFGFDLDTPVDCVLAAMRAECGPRLVKAVSGWELWRRVEAVRAVLDRGEYADVALLGRVHPVEAERFGQGCKVRLRVYSEERGMKALGRIERGEVRSLVGAMVEAVGWKRFFAVLEEQAGCVLFDTRVALEHLGVHVSERERFAADLGMVEEIQHPVLRELAEAAASCRIPVLMGGQSLVGGGLRIWLDV
ncbi:hypothetical protein CBW65_08560 [Tumebacillus avium]|uniref:Uncharacterized protein n=2 Tax=Tumebacillus avium TaxID=1903704 RepID=A0A1Y0IKS0_9BACL|nr:hypothetical protein CBW65_08560 [Tumebacillus avium]